MLSRYVNSWFTQSPAATAIRVLAIYRKRVLPWQRMYEHNVIQHVLTVYNILGLVTL